MENKSREEKQDDKISKTNSKEDECSFDFSDEDWADSEADVPEYVDTIDIAKRICSVEDWSMLVYGPRRSGKSVFINKLIKYIHRVYKKIIVFKSTTEFGRYEFDERITNITVTKLTTEKLQKIIDMQQALKKRKIKYPILIIFDDVLDKVAKDEKTLLDIIAYNGRHMMISIIFSTQTMTRVITTGFRDNMDYTILGKPRGSSQKFIYDNYFKFKNIDYNKTREVLKEYEKIFIDDVDGEIYLVSAE